MQASGARVLGCDRIRLRPDHAHPLAARLANSRLVKAFIRIFKGAAMRVRLQPWEGWGDR